MENTNAALSQFLSQNHSYYGMMDRDSILNPKPINSFQIKPLMKGISHLKGSNEYLNIFDQNFDS